MAKGACAALSARGRRSIRFLSAPWHTPDGYAQAAATRLDKIYIQRICKPAATSTARSRLRTRPNYSSSEESDAATVAIVGRERGRVLTLLMCFNRRRMHIARVENQPIRRLPCLLCTDCRAAIGSGNAQIQISIGCGAVVAYRRCVPGDQPLPARCFAPTAIGSSSSGVAMVAFQRVTKPVARSRRRSRRSRLAPMLAKFGEHLVGHGVRQRRRRRPPTRSAAFSAALNSGLAGASATAASLSLADAEMQRAARRVRHANRGRRRRGSRHGRSGA